MSKFLRITRQVQRNAFLLCSPVQQIHSLKVKDQLKLSNIPVIFRATSQLVCMSKYTSLVATLHRRRNPLASSLSLSAIHKLGNTPSEFRAYSCSAVMEFSD